MACSNLGNFKNNLPIDIGYLLIDSKDFKSGLKEIFKMYFELEDYEKYKEDSESILKDFSYSYSKYYIIMTNGLRLEKKQTLSEQGFKLNPLVSEIINNEPEAIKQGIEMLLKLHSGYVVENDDEQIPQDEEILIPESKKTIGDFLKSALKIANDVIEKVGDIYKNKKNKKKIARVSDNIAYLFPFDDELYKFNYAYADLLKSQEVKEGELVVTTIEKINANVNNLVNGSNSQSDKGYDAIKDKTLWKEIDAIKTTDKDKYIQELKKALEDSIKRYFERLKVITKGSVSEETHNKKRDMILDRLNDEGNNVANKFPYVYHFKEDYVNLFEEIKKEAINKIKSKRELGQKIEEAIQESIKDSKSNADVVKLLEKQIKSIKNYKYAFFEKGEDMIDDVFEQRKKELIQSVSKYVESLKQLSKDYDITYQSKILNESESTAGTMDILFVNKTNADDFFIHELKVSTLFTGRGKNINDYHITLGSKTRKERIKKSDIYEYQLLSYLNIIANGDKDVLENLVNGKSRVIVFSTLSNKPIEISAENAHNNFIKELDPLISEEEAKKKGKQIEFDESYYADKREKQDANWRFKNEQEAFDNNDFIGNSTRTILTPQETYNAVNDATNNMTVNIVMEQDATGAIQYNVYDSAKRRIGYILSDTQGVNKFVNQSYEKYLFDVTYGIGDMKVGDSMEAVIQFNNMGEDYNLKLEYATKLSETGKETSLKEYEESALRSFSGQTGIPESELGVKYKRGSIDKDENIMFIYRKSDDRVLFRIKVYSGNHTVQEVKDIIQNFINFNYLHHDKKDVVKSSEYNELIKLIDANKWIVSTILRDLVFDRVKEKGGVVSTNTSLNIDKSVVKLKELLISMENINGDKATNFRRGGNILNIENEPQYGSSVRDVNFEIMLPNFTVKKKVNNQQQYNENFEKFKKDYYRNKLLELDEQYSNAETEDQKNDILAEINKYSDILVGENEDFKNEVQEVEELFGYNLNNNDSIIAYHLHDIIKGVSNMGIFTGKSVRKYHLFSESAVKDGHNLIALLKKNYSSLDSDNFSAVCYTSKQILMHLGYAYFKALNGHVDNGFNKKGLLYYPKTNKEKVQDIAMNNFIGVARKYVELAALNKEMSEKDAELLTLLFSDDKLIKKYLFPFSTSNNKDNKDNKDTHKDDEEEESPDETIAKEDSDEEGNPPKEQKKADNIIDGAASLTFDKSASENVKEMILYIERINEVKLSDMKTVNLTNEKERFVDNKNLKSNLATIIYFKYDGNNKTYSPPTNVGDIRDNIHSYLLHNSNRSATTEYKDVAAFYNKYLNPLNPNSLINVKGFGYSTARAMEQLTALFNTLGSYRKTSFVIAQYGAIIEANKIDNKTRKRAEFKSRINKLRYSDFKKAGLNVDKKLNVLVYKNSSGQWADIKNISVKELNELFVSLGILTSEDFLLFDENGIPTAFKEKFESVYTYIKNNGYIDISNKEEGFLSIFLDHVQSSRFEEINSSFRVNEKIQSSEILASHASDSLDMIVNDISANKHSSIEKLMSLNPVWKYNRLLEREIEVGGLNVKRYGISKYAYFLGIQNPTKFTSFTSMTKEDIYKRAYEYNMLAQIKSSSVGRPKIWIQHSQSSNKIVSYQVLVDNLLDYNAENIKIINATEQNDKGEYIYFDGLNQKDMAVIKEEIYQKVIQNLIVNHITETNKIRNIIAIDAIKNSTNKDKRKDIPIMFGQFIDENGKVVTIRTPEYEYDKTTNEITLKEDINKYKQELFKHYIAMVEQRKKHVGEEVREQMSRLVINDLIYKWDLDTHIALFPLLYKNSDDFNKRFSLPTSQGSRTDDSFKYGIGRKITILPYKKIKKYMPMLTAMGFFDTVMGEKDGTGYNPYDGATITSPLFTVLLQRATGGELGLNLRDKSSAKPVEAFIDRENLNTVLLKTATFEVFDRMIEQFPPLREMLHAMIDGLIDDPEFKKQNGDYNWDKMADWYQANNAFVNIKNPNKRKYFKFPSAKVQQIYDELVKNEKEDDRFHKINLLIADPDAMKSFLPENIENYQAFNEDGSINPLDSQTDYLSNQVKIDSKNFIFQLNPSHDADYESMTSMPTQIAFISPLSYADDTDGQAQKIENIEAGKKLYGAMNKLADIKFQQLFGEGGEYMVQNNKGEWVINLNKVKEEVIEKSQVSEQEKLILLTEGISNNLPIIQNLILRRMLSTLSNEIIRLKHFGTDYVLYPNIGFDIYDYNGKIYTYDRLPDEAKATAKPRNLRWYNLKYKMEDDTEMSLDDIIKQEQQKVESLKLSYEEKYELAVQNAKRFIDEKKVSAVGEVEVIMPLSYKNEVKKVLKQLEVEVDKDFIKLNPDELYDKIKQSKATDEVKQKAINILNEAFRGIGIRIPSTGKNSGVVFKVVAFIDTPNNIIIAPTEIVKIHGSDYDVDKLKVLANAITNMIDDLQKTINPELKDKERNPKKEVEYQVNELRKEIFEILSNVLKSPANIYESLSDISFDQANTVIKYLESGMGEILKSSNMPFSSTESDAYYQYSNMVNRDLVGIFATSFKAFSYLSFGEAKLKSPLNIFGQTRQMIANHANTSVIINNEARNLLELFENNPQFTKHEKLAYVNKYFTVAATLNIDTNAAIDAVKEQIHGAKNVNLTTAPVKNVLMQLGVDNTIIDLFLNQRLIRLYAEQSDANKKLIEIYFDKLDKSSSEYLMPRSSDDRQKMLSLISQNTNLTLDQLKELLAKKDDDVLIDDIMKEIANKKKKVKKEESSTEETTTEPNEDDDDEETIDDDNEVLSESQKTTTKKQTKGEARKELLSKLSNNDKAAIKLLQAFLAINLTIADDLSFISKVFSVNQGYDTDLTTFKRDYDNFQLVKANKRFDVFSKKETDSLFDVNDTFNYASYFGTYYKIMNDMLNTIDKSFILGDKLYFDVLNKVQNSKSGQLTKKEKADFAKIYFSCIAELVLGVDVVDIPLIGKKGGYTLNNIFDRQLFLFDVPRYTQSFLDSDESKNYPKLKKILNVFNNNVSITDISTMSKYSMEAANELKTLEKDNNSPYNKLSRLLYIYNVMTNGLTFGRNTNLIMDIEKHKTFSEALEEYANNKENIKIDSSVIARQMFNKIKIKTMVIKGINAHEKLTFNGNVVYTSDIDAAFLILNEDRKKYSLARLSDFEIDALNKEANVNLDKKIPYYAKGRLVNGMVSYTSNNFSDNQEVISSFYNIAIEVEDDYAYVQAVMTKELLAIAVKRQSEATYLGKKVISITEITDDKTKKEYNLRDELLLVEFKLQLENSKTEKLSEEEIKSRLFKQNDVLNKPKADCL